MSTDLEPYQPSGLAPREIVDGWVTVVSDVAKLANMIADTEFVPKPLQGKPAAITAAILAGREAGIPPLRALSHMHVIDGRPSMSAEQKRALALAAGHEIVYVETTTERCIVKGRRAGSDQWSTVVWTKDDAKAAGIVGRDNWRRWPRRMLQARATGELADMLFADATAGLATTEELVDETDAAGITSNGQVEPKRTARRKTSVAPSYPDSAEQRAEQLETTLGLAKLQVDIANQEQPPQPPLPGEDGYDWPDTQQPPTDDELQIPVRLQGFQQGLGYPISGEQMKKMHAIFGQLKIRDREERLALTKAIVNRELSTANELTKDEASALIDVLEQATRQADPVKWLGTIVLRPDGEVE
jgi:hypothetical protein